MLALIGTAAVLLAGPAVWPGSAGDVEAELTAPDSGRRMRALLDVAREEPEGAPARLLVALRDRDAGVRLEAARLLARRGAREATAAATEWLAERGAHERFMGLIVLGEAPGLPDEARRAVERALRTGDLTARLRGLDVLAARPAPSSFGPVVAMLDDELADVRLRAVRALAALRDPRATLPVARRLADGDRGVRLEAATTLGVLGDRRAVPALLRQLDEGTPDPRTSAVDALGRLGDAAAVPALARLARRSPRDELSRHAALALGGIASPEALEALVALAREPLESDDARLALERAGQAAVRPLIREVQGPSPTGARVAAQALGRIGDRAATAALADAVLRGTAARVAALEALAHLADPAALPALAHVALVGEAPELRAMALEALEAIGDERAAALLPRALSDADPTVRARAARLAGRLGAGESRLALVGRLSDDDAGVRREAAVALARLPPPSGAPIASIADAVARGSFEAQALDALGDVLERGARAGDQSALVRAYLAAATPAARAPLARGLAAASAETPLDDDRAVAALLRDAATDDQEALGACEALAQVRRSRATEAALVQLYARGEPQARARLSPALVGFDAGVGALAEELRDASQPPSVRAAAAWALAGSHPAREALRDAAAGPDGPVAANARAALARDPAEARRRHPWAAVEVVTAAGEAEAGRWVEVSSGGGPPVWALTDAWGRALVAGLPAGALTVRSPPR